MNEIRCTSASKLRLAFVGDSITVGDGDTQARGWPSRLCEEASPIPAKTHCYNLGVGGDLISDVASRIVPELKSRLAGKTGRGVVMMIGVNNALRAAAKINRTPLERDFFVADMEFIVSEAQRFGTMLVVEPAPVLPEFVHRDGIKGLVVLEHLVKINELLASVCEDKNVAFLSLTNKLLNDPAYVEALNDGDGLHPHDLGYERIASHIGASTEWCEFLQFAEMDV